jgi:S-adenosylmethionine hydrolase
MLGPPLDPELLMPGVVPLPQSDDTKVIAQVLWIDRFGNAQLNVSPDDLDERYGERVELRVHVPADPSGGTPRHARRVSAFAELTGGALGLLVDSTGLLAIAMDQRSAAEELGLDAGDQVTLTPADTGAPATDGPPPTQPVSIRPSR